jgi:hypothetical protein
VSAPPLTPFSQAQKASGSSLKADGAARGDLGFNSPGAALSGSDPLTGGSSGSGAAAAATAAGSRSGLAVVPMQAGGGGTIGQSGASASGYGSGGGSGGEGAAGGVSSSGGGGGGGAAGGAGAAAADSSAAYKKNDENAKKCEAATSKYEPKIRKANDELKPIGQRIGDVCRRDVKCAFASDEVCRDDYWMWRGVCNCARVHCQFKAKCEEIDQLTCAQLRACPMTATQPCVHSDCDQ